MVCRHWPSVLTLCLALLIAGCGSPEPTSTPAALEPAAAPDLSPEAVALQEVERWLEGYLGRPLLDLDVAYGAQEWPDAGLGCPEPGETYAQVVTPGYRFDIIVDGVLYELHTDLRAGRIVLCPSELTGDRPGRPEEMASAKARMLLGEALGVDPDQVPQPLTRESAAWTDAAMGCPSSDQAAPAAETVGFRFQFLTGDELYDVRASSDGSAAVLCPQTESLPESETTLDSFESQPIGFAILYPAGWWVAARENIGEVAFRPGNDLPTLGMTITRSGGEPVTVDECLATLESELVAGDRTAATAGAVQTVGGDARSGRYRHQLGGGYVVERITCYPEGYLVRQWAPADQSAGWEKPFLRMLDSLRFLAAG